jgi:hypothetical protein
MYYKDPHNVIFLDIVRYWDDMACNLAQIARRFGVAYCLHHMGKNSNTILCSMCKAGEDNRVERDVARQICAMLGSLQSVTAKTDCRQRDGHSSPFQGHHVLAGSRLRNGYRRDTPSTGAPHQV